MHWNTIISSSHSKFMVRGTELSNAIVPMTMHRFQVCEIRTWDGDESDRTYHVRDAETITDAEIRDGVRPSIVFRHNDLDECVRWCAAQCTAWGEILP